MRLKKLELQGFKSFPDKTTVNFDKGLTVIVGPNGSGKSNISDAMRWVLGEMSTKNIRGTKMEDVIFAGSQKRSPMSFAEVSVTFDNSEEEGRLVTAEDYDEITVTRRYYRAGESEYFINRKPVRLRDIHELFLNTGLGKGGYSSIGQGKIAEIISRKNDERRAVFEEAAGIAKYKFQKLEAMRNLDGTNENLTRLEDITGELSARIGPLERESAKAKKYLEIYERKKGIDIALSLYDIDAAKRRSADVSEKLAIAKRNLEAAEEKLSDAEARESALAEKQSGNRIEAERFTQEIAAQKEKLHEKESAALVCESENVHFAETEKTARAKLAESEAERASTEKELTAKREALEEARRKKAEKKEEADKKFIKAIQRVDMQHTDNFGRFYRGTLKNGQRIETESSMVILGDVYPGCSVTATKDIIIIGGLYGEVHAGFGGEEGHYVVALEMSPEKIKIGDFRYKPKEKFKWGIKPKIQPKIAYVKDSHIVMEPITKELLEFLTF